MTQSDADGTPLQPALFLARTEAEVWGAIDALWQKLLDSDDPTEALQALHLSSIYMDDLLVDDSSVTGSARACNCDASYSTVVGTAALHLQCWLLNLGC